MPLCHQNSEMKLFLLPHIWSTVHPVKSWTFQLPLNACSTKSILQFPESFWVCLLANLRPYNDHKLQFRSKQCVFLGYSNLHKGFKCLDVPTGVSIYLEMLYLMTTADIGHQRQIAAGGIQCPCKPGSETFDHCWLGEQCSGLSCCDFHHRIMKQTDDNSDFYYWLYGRCGLPCLNRHQNFFITSGLYVRHTLGD